MVKSPKVSRQVSRLEKIKIKSPYKITLDPLVYWSGRCDSNTRPLAPHASTLPGCATPRLVFIVSV